MPEKFNVGYQARMMVSWMPGGRVRRTYGVVMSSSDKLLTVVPAYPADPNTKFYDTGGSIESRDCHNVLLTSCPPPGTTLCTQSETEKCYAYADPARRLQPDKDDFSLIRLRLDDGGKKISEEDYKDILDHLWRDEKQKSIPVRRASALEQIRASI